MLSLASTELATNRKLGNTVMAKSKKLGWTHKEALKVSGGITHMSGCVKLSDGTFGALARITFAPDYSSSSREYKLRDGFWSGDTLISRGMIDSAPAWIAEAQTRNRNA